MALAYETHKTLVRFPEFWIGSVHFDSRYVSTYSFFLTLACLAIFLIALREAKKRKLSPRLVVLLTLSGLAGGFFGARLLAISLWEHHGFTGYVTAFFDFSHAGLSSAGAFLGIIAATAIWLSRKNVWKYLDLFGIGAGIGIAFARLGCFSAGCCYGSPADLPWSIYYKEALRHPAQLYDLLNGVLIFIFMQRLKLKRLFDGALFISFIILYSFIRFFIEFARAGPKLFSLTYNQYIYGILCIAGILLFWHMRKKSRH